MRPKTKSLSSMTSTNWIPLSWHWYSLVTVVSDGADLKYSVEYTTDNIQDPTVTPTPTTVAGMVSITDSADGNIAFTVRAVRLTVEEYTSGSVSLTITENRRS